MPRGIPVVTPAGGLGCHLDAKGFLPHVPQLEYPAGALAAALVHHLRHPRHGTRHISMDRDADGNDVPSEVELLRLAMPRRVFTLSQVKYVEDRVKWLYQNRELVGGLEFYDEPKVLRFFVGRLRAQRATGPRNWSPSSGRTFPRATERDARDGRLRH